MEAKLTEEVLQSVEDCGAVEMPIAETCAIAGIDETDYWGSEAAQRRYRLGQLRTKFEMRQAVVKIAKSGNPAMVKVYQDFAAENEATMPVVTGAETESGGEFDSI